MATIKLTDAFMDVLNQKQLTGKELVLVTDDGGGKYSIEGGACSLGANFTIIVLDQADPDYAVKLENDRGIHFWTSDYDMMFFESGLTLDYKNHNIEIRDDAHVLDNAVVIANGADVLAAGTTVGGNHC